MLRSVGFLLLLLFSVSSSHDAKKLVLAENELQDSSTLTCDGVPSCSRKGDPYKSNGSTIGSEIQSSRLLLMADLDRAASRGVLSPSIPYSQSRPLPSTTILSPAQNMLNNSKLASSANRLTSVFESPSVFSGNLRNKGSNWLLLCTINTPHFCSLSTPHFAVQPLLHPPTHKQFFSKLVLDHMPHLGTPKLSVPPVSLQGVTSKSLIPHAHVHNVPPFKNFHQEANHNGAPYFVIPPSSLTTGKMKHIEAASSPYDSVRSGPSLPLTQDRHSQESLHFGKYTRSVQPSYALPVTVPSLVPMHHGQPQDPSSRRVQAPENTPPVRFLPPSNALPLQALPPIASNGEQTRGPFVNEHQPPRVLPPTLASQGPTMVTSPPLVSSRAQQYQMHPSAFHPVMPNPSNHKIWLSPRVIGTPSQIQSPVGHSRASFSPSGSVSSPHASLPIESPSGHAGTPAFTPSFKGTVSSPTSLPSEPLKEAPSSIFPSHAHRHSMRGPVASSPSIFPSEPSQKKPSVPLAAWAKNISKGQAPVAFAPRIQEHVIPPINPPSKSPIVYSGGSHANHHNMRGSVASSPVIFPTEPPQKKPSVPLASWPKNISKGQAPVFFAPRIQEHVTPPISLPSKPSMEYPGRPHAHHHNMRGSVASSPSIFPSEPPQKKPTVPLAEWPKNISKGQAPIAFAPRIQEHVIPSISPPSKSPMYSGRSHVHRHIRRGSVDSSPSIFPFEPPQNKPSVPLAAWPKNISKGQVPVAFAPSIQEHVTPPISLPSEPSMEYPGRSHAHHHNMRGSIASSPSIFPSEPPQKKPTVPLAEWPKNISKGQAPIAFAPRIQGHVIPSISPPSKSPMYSGRSNVHHHIMRGSVASSPSIFPSEPPQNKPSVPLAARPKNISKGQVPVAFAPSIQEHVTPPISLPSKPPTEYPGRYHAHHHNMRGSVASSPSIFPSEPPQKKPTVPLAEWPKNISKGQAPIAFAPRIQEHVIPPISPPSKSPMYSGRSHVHHHIVQGSVASSPSIFPSEPPQNKPSVPLAAWPKNISKGQVPVAFAPSIQEHRIPPISLPSKPPTEYPGRPESAPSIAFHSPKYHRGKNVQGPVTSSPSIFPFVPHQKKPSIPVAAQPRSRLKRQTPEPVAPSISISSEPPIEYPGTPEASPLIRVHSPPNNQNVKGPSASPPSLSPSISHRQKSIIPVANQPGKRSWRHSPAMTAPIMQGHHTPPRNAPSEPPPKNLRIPVAPPPTIRSQWHAPLVIPPRSQGHFSPPPLASPPEHYRRHSGVLPVPPSVTFPTPPYHQRMKGPVAAPTNIASSKAPEKTPNVAWEAPPRPVSSPFESPKGGTIHPAPAPSKMSPTNHYRGMKGPAASTPRLFPSGPSKKKPSIPMAAPPSKRSLEHAPGPVSSPFESPKGNAIRPAPAPSKISTSTHHYPGMKGPVAPTPRLFPSGPSQKKPSIPMAPPPSKRSSEHAPVASPPMVEGPVSSPFESPKGNTIHPAPAPSKISPSTHHYRGMKGPVASTPRLFPSGPSQKKPSIPMTAPPSKISSEHAPVASPPMVEGPVYSPVNHPLLSPSANLRPPAVSPSIRFPSPPHHRHMKGPSASPAPALSRVSPTPYHYWGMKGPVASTPRMIPSVPAQKKPSIPMAAPPNKSSLKHTPVASPPMVEGNLRPPAVSPSIRFPSPPHHRRVKGPVYSPAKSPLPSPVRNLRPPAASPSFSFPSPRNHRYAKGPSAPPPNIASSEPPQTTRGIPLAAPPLVFPPPPPAQDCSSISCTQPLTSTPPGAPCGCVYPMQVELELGVALYAFFPLVSELAAEIAAGTFLKQSQVRIMGANADSQDQEKTIVMLDLVPLGEKFDNTTAFLIFERFWQKKVIINGTLFGDYWVILVYYPGLPPPPPSAFSNANIDGEPTNSNGPGKHEPLGVDINKRGKKMGAGIIVVVSLSSAFGAVICVGAVWITVLKCKNRSRPTSAVVEPTIGSSVKRSGVGGGSILSGSMASSTSMSFASSMAPYTGSAKTLTIAELERATDRFNPQNILGEGGFGRVYRGVLEDGTKVAVKVLTRDDQQGGREFIAEVEMLSRLHHRNLVKLIGICTEEHNRSLVYELIPNGSVESHLHGVDKETAPLDWDARIKIALGAARGLAYLHEDSSPRVIHRDFKASNILLEDDFTPKVSDFGLAKSASEEVSGHISTRVMGTFGYVAPEYAMTGHLLVKSDVYSYGVVLLELLTGRKPVDMSQPPGQENLVTWARPLLTSKEGLEALVDPALGNSLPFDNIARVAAIASMCVQPEVSHRPFMGEVVQALKLVYNDSDASNGGGSGSFSHGGESNAHDIEVKDDSSQQWPQSIQYVPDGSSFVTIDYDSGPLRTQGLETERPLSASALLSTSGSSLRQLSGSFRRHSSSGPLRTNKSKKSWHGIRGLAGGSISEHGVKRHEDVHELWP